MLTKLNFNDSTGEIPNSNTFIITLQLFPIFYWLDFPFNRNNNDWLLKTC